MRELNEKELEQVAGGCLSYAGGVAEAGSLVNISEGAVGSSSSAGLVVKPRMVMAGAENMIIAIGNFGGGVIGGASVRGEVLS